MISAEEALTEIREGLEKLVPMASTHTGSGMVKHEYLPHRPAWIKLEDVMNILEEQERNNRGEHETT